MVPAKKTAAAKSAATVSLPRTLKDQMQAHLNLSWSADGLVYSTETRGKIIETGGATWSLGTNLGRWRGTHNRELVVKLVLRYVVNRNIEAGCVGDIEDFKLVF